MTATYDPRHRLYIDEHDVRIEMSRVFEICFGCQKCVSLCPTFPTLFSLIELKVEHDAGRLTPHEQDEVAGQCFRCSLCSSVCPFTPNHHEFAVDFPRLIDRHRAMQRKNRQWSMRSSIGHVLLGRMGLVVRSISQLQSGGLARRLLARITSISATHSLLPRAHMRFSTWFVRRKEPVVTGHSQVAVFPTCVVEYAQPNVGHALIGVFETNGIACSLIAPEQCCGAPSLLHGDMQTFLTTAARNVELMVDTARNGADIVVPSPMCYSIIKSDYPHYIPSADVDLVATHTFEASEYLVRRLGEGSLEINTNFSGVVPDSITHCVPMEMRARGISECGRDLMSLTGARVSDVWAGSGSQTLWEAHTDNEGCARQLGEEAEAAVSDVSSEVVVSDCPWSCGEWDARGATENLHPMELLARAYGIGSESGVSRHRPRPVE